MGKGDSSGWNRFDSLDDALKELNMGEEKETLLRKATDIDAVEANAKEAVNTFAERWVPMPSFNVGVEVMDIAQLRDAMGLRATVDWGDPWPAAESLLLSLGFR